MDTAQVSEAFKLDPPLPGDLSWDQAQTTLSFTPANLLPPEVDFAIDFQGDLLDAQGLATILKKDELWASTDSTTGMVVMWIGRKSLCEC